LLVVRVRGGGGIKTEAARRPGLAIQISNFSGH